MPTVRYKTRKTCEEDRKQSVARWVIAKRITASEENTLTLKHDHFSVPSLDAVIANRRITLYSWRGRMDRTPPSNPGDIPEGTQPRPVLLWWSL